MWPHVIEIENIFADDALNLSLAENQPERMDRQPGKFSRCAEADSKCLSIYHVEGFRQVTVERTMCAVSFDITWKT